MRLLIADDHGLFRDALVQYIMRAEPEASIQLAKDFHEAMDIMRRDPEQDLVLLDLRMPGMNGMEGFKALREAYPDVRAGLMSGTAESHHISTAIELGAAGYFPKTLSGKALLQAIESVLCGEIFVPVDSLANTLMPSYYDDRIARDEHANSNEFVNAPGGDFDAEAEFRLTPREKEVLSYLMQGASNKEIANALGLQLVTIKLHVRGVCKKLNAKNRTQAAMRAQALGFGAY